MQSLVKSEWPSMLYDKTGGLKLVSLEEIASSLANYSDLFQVSVKSEQFICTQCIGEKEHYHIAQYSSVIKQ